MDNLTLLLTVSSLMTAFILGPILEKLSRSTNKKQLIVCYIIAAILVYFGIRMVINDQVSTGQTLIISMWVVLAYMDAIIYALYGRNWAIAAVILGVFVLTLAIPYRLLMDND